MTLVVDSSIALEWLLGQARAEEAGRAFKTRENLLVHPLFWLEILNVLAKRVRRGVLTTSQRDIAWDGLNRVRLTTLTGDVAQSLLPQILRLAEHHWLSAYDAAHLATALHMGGEFATLDAALASAARQAGGSLFDLGEPRRA
jgi:predicted nucleic acid-binding protein